MKRVAAHALRLAACLWFLGVLALPAEPARAQSAGEPPAPYQDRLIDGGGLTPDISSGDVGTSDLNGLARSVRIDAVASILQQQGANAGPDTHEDGLILNAQWDTASYGAWSLDAAERISGEPTTSVTGRSFSDYSFSLHERGMPFDDGWQTDNALGDLNAPLINIERAQPRFLLAQGPLEGIYSEWRGPDGIQIVASAGEPGIYDGIKVLTFDGLGGSTATLGAQWSPAPQWTLGGQFAGARNVDLYYVPLDTSLVPALDTSQRISSNTGLLSAAWQEGSTRAQFNLIDGTLDGNSNAFGLWADVSHSYAGVTQSFGAFRIDPNLAWGNQLITSDVEGGYYRVDYQSRRWFADFGVDEVKSVDGAAPTITFINTDARYQLSRDTGVGGVVNLRHSDGDTAWSVEGYLDNVNSLGTGRAQVDYATDSQTSDTTVTLQQTWNTRVGARLSTSAAVDRVTGSAVLGVPQDATIARLAVYGGGNLTARLSLDGSVQWATTVQGRAAPSTAANVSLAYQISRNWSVLGSYYESRVGSWEQLIVTSPLAPPTINPIPSQGVRGFFLTVRYEAARGAHFVPLGGTVGSGSGRLSGVIYLDANENGRFDAGETGVANVTVILDGRFSVRTDSSGRFDFPAVAAGHHIVTVQGDNLPLPWALSNSGRTEVEVGTRDRTEVDIAAQRIK